MAMQVTMPDGETERGVLSSRILKLIDTFAEGRVDGALLEALLVDIARWQALHVCAYGRLLASRGIDIGAITHAADLPAMPTDVFRFARIAAHSPEEDIATFQTSGTTSGARGQVHVRDIAHYDRSAQAAAVAALFPDAPASLGMINLVPRAVDAPDSSLAHMVFRFQEWFGDGEGVYAWRNGALDAAVLADSLDRTEAEGRPTCLLGTSFAFLFAEEALGDKTWKLARGSRVMQTGGFKGRTREVRPEEMRQMIVARYGIPEDLIVAEYGMSELSSQLYETPLADRLAGRLVGPRRLKAPPWVRVVLTDPETLLPIAGDGIGLIRIEDPANLDTAWAIQTSDLGQRLEDGIVLLGRASDATLRGCSLSVEEAMDRNSATAPMERAEGG